MGASKEGIPTGEQALLRPPFVFLLGSSIPLPAARACLPLPFLSLELWVGSGQPLLQVELALIMAMNPDGGTG